MTVIRNGVERDPIRRVWVKKRFPFGISGGITEGSTHGNEVCIAAVTGPAYSFPEYIQKLHVTAIGFTEMEPWAQSEFITRASFVNVPQSTTQSAWDSPTTLMNTHAPIDADAADGSVVTADEVGITGRYEAPLRDGKTHKLFDRSYECKLGKNSYNTNASKIRYLVDCDYKGHPYNKGMNMVDINSPWAIFVGAHTNTSNVTSDISEGAFGNHTDYDDLYASLLDGTDRDIATGGSSEHVDDPSAFTDSALAYYQQLGWAAFDSNLNNSYDNAAETTAAINKSDDFLGHVDVTMSIRLYKPSTMHTLMAP